MKIYTVLHTDIIKYMEAHDATITHAYNMRIDLLIIYTHVVVIGVPYNWVIDIYKHFGFVSGPKNTASSIDANCE